MDTALLMEVCKELIIHSEIWSLHRHFKISYVKDFTLALDLVFFLIRNAFHFSHSYDSYQEHLAKWIKSISWVLKQFLQIFIDNHSFEDQIQSLVHMNHISEQPKVQMKFFGSANICCSTYGLNVMFSTKILPRTQALSSIPFKPAQ